MFNSAGSILCSNLGGNLVAGKRRTDRHQRDFFGSFSLSSAFRQLRRHTSNLPSAPVAVNDEWPKRAATQRLSLLSKEPGDTPGYVPVFVDCVKESLDCSQSWFRVPRVPSSKMEDCKTRDEVANPRWMDQTLRR